MKKDTTIRAFKREALSFAGGRGGGGGGGGNVVIYDRYAQHGGKWKSLNGTQGKTSVDSFRNHCVIEQKIKRKSIIVCDFCVIFCSITQ